MTLGSSFTTVRDGEWLECEVVWTGGMPLSPYTGPYAADLAISPQSSLHGLSESLPTRQTALAINGGRSRCTVVSQTALRA